MSDASDNANLMVVTGFGGRDDVLLETRDARCLQWHDENGELMAMLIRVNKKLWGLCLRGDDDWAEMVKLYGVKPKKG